MGHSGPSEAYQLDGRYRVHTGHSTGIFRNQNVYGRF
jgi:hypothetical protein